MNHARIANAVFNRPQMVEPQYARTFVSALARYLPDLNIRHITLPDGTQLDRDAMAASIDGYSRSERKLFQEINGIAVIAVEGTLTHRFGHLDPYSGMTGYDGIQAKLDAALDDDAIDGILLDIDSPGGAVSGCFDLADAIFEARQEKPVWGIVDELCASAAFALGSACNRLIAPRTAQIGSVGVVTMHVDQSQMLEKEGIDVTFVYAGDHKIDGNSFEPLPEDVRADIQADINNVYDMFVQLVARNRGMNEQAVRDTEARVYGSKEAKRVGLIDQIMPARDVIAAFDADLRAGRAGQSTPSRSAQAMRILGLGRKAKQGDPDTEQGKAVIADPLASDAAPASLTTPLETAAATVDNHAAPSPAADTPEAEAAQSLEGNIGEPLFTAAEAQAQFGPQAEAASLDVLMDLCTEHGCTSLTKALHERGVTQAQAEAIVADVDDIRDKAAATFPDDPEAATKLANNFIHGAYVEQRFGGAFASLMVEATARASGEEVDHHPPASAEQSAGSGNFNAVKFYQRKR